MLVVYLLSSMDRVNVSFAALTMNDDLHFDPGIYGFGVGLFFVSYMLFQLPGAALIRRFGAARPLAIMMVAWGFCASLMSCINGRFDFYVLRFLLGLAEAGVVPAATFYLANWVPRQNLGRIMTWAALSLPMAVIIGAPLSGWLLTQHSIVHSLPGWRWMFFVEGLPTVILGVVAYFRLTESPAEVRWLTHEQREWLMRELEKDRPKQSLSTYSSGQTAGLWTVLSDRNILTIALAYFCIAMGTYGLLYWLPQVIKAASTGLSPMAVTLVSTMPWIAAAAGMLLNGWHSDRNQERCRHVATGALIGALGLILSCAFSSPWLALLGLVATGFGQGAAQGLYMAIPIDLLRGNPAAPTAFALINMIGNCAGLVGANLIGWLRNATGSFSMPIEVLAAVLVVGALLLVSLPRLTPGRQLAHQ